MKYQIAAVILALCLTSCGASCQTERATVAELSDMADPDADLEPARAALQACEAEEAGEWLRMILQIAVKVL